MKLRTKILLAYLIVIPPLFWRGGTVLISPAQTPIGAAPSGLNAEDISFGSDGGIPIRGWFVPGKAGKAGKGAVLLLHGNRSNRLEMVPRAVFLSHLGYSVLLIDLRGHGESGGDHLTFGAAEARDAEAAIQFLHAKIPGEKLGAIGVSLGGAALILGHHPLGLSAMVLESVYPTIEDALENRLRMKIGPFAHVAGYPFLWQLRLRLGLDPSDLHPIDHIADVQTPVFLLAGTADEHTTIRESHALFDAAVDPKQSWWVEGAEHVPLHDFARTEYEKRVGEFLARYLRPTQE